MKIVMDITSFKKGDKIVDGGRVYQIYKISKEIVFFKPFFKEDEHTALTSSIPLDSISKTSIRKVISKSEMNSALKDLASKSESANPLDVNLARNLLQTNDIKEVVSVLKRLWV
ncbi:hypothetical protein DRH14_03700, partial [Candidatus Shapirobacteria bacterium]